MTLTAAGSPYTGTSVEIAPGATVTVEPGVAIRLASTLTVNGTLRAQGTADAPVLFTSSQDTRGGWSGVVFNAGSSGSIVEDATVRNSNSSGITINAASPIIRSSNIRSNNFHGIEAKTSGTPKITNNTISDNSYLGVKVSIASGQQGSIDIQDNLIERNRTGGISVTASTAYTQIQSASIARNTINDNLGKAIYYDAYAISDNTSYHSNPAPPDITTNSLSGNRENGVWISGEISQPTTWQKRSYPLVVHGSGITVPTGSGLTLAAGLIVKNDMRSIVVSGSLDAQGAAAEPVTITSVRDDSIAGDTNGDGGATQPAPGDWSKVLFKSSATGTINHAALRWGGSSGYGGDYATIAIKCPCSAPPAIMNSLITRSQYNGIRVDAGSPTLTGNTITFNDGTGIQVHTSGAPKIANNTISDNAGSGITTSIAKYQQGSIDIQDNLIERNRTGGISVTASTAYTQIQSASIARNTINDNLGKAIHYNAYAISDNTSYHSNPAPPDITTNSLSGNRENGVWISGEISQPTTWQKRSYPLVVHGNGITVPTGSGLTLDPGVIVKNDMRSIEISGRFDAQGTAAEPITLTSIKDDSVAGDTNGDGGATRPAPGDWSEVLFKGSSTGNVDHSRIRWGGSSYYGGNYSAIALVCPCPNPPTIRNSVITGSVNDGLRVKNDLPAGAAPFIADSAIRGNLGNGVTKTGGTGTMRAPRIDWGCDSGPKPAGCGNAVNGAVNYTPVALASRPDGQCNGQESQCPVGADPVSLATGSLIYSHSDLELTGRSLPLVFERSYNSSTVADTGLGPGWSHTGLISVSETPTGDVAVVWPDGRQDTFKKIEAAYQAPSGSSDRLSKSSTGAFVLKTLDRTTYHFRLDGRIGQIVDDHGLTTTYGYDLNGRLATVTDPSGQRFTYAYDASNHITSVADSTGRKVQFTYTSAGDLDTATDALGGITDYGYDAQHRLTTIKDPRGTTFLTNTYDAQGRVTEQRDALNNLWTIGYGAGQTTVTDPRGGQQIARFDSQLRTTSVTDQLQHTTSYGYDPQGNLDQVTRPGAAVASLDYDATGNLTAATDPEGGKQAFGYDSLNRLTSYTDERNKAWSYTWNSSNDLSAITDPAGKTTAITYTSAGQPLTITDPNDHRTTYSYDSRGNVTAVADALGHATAYGYNAYNHLTAVTKPGLNAETYSRNALGDLLSVTSPEGNTTSFGYDPNGALTSITDPALNQWQIVRDGMERPIKYVDPLLLEATIAYDSNLNPTSVTDRNGHTTNYAYDAANQLTKIDAPATGEWQFSYDARGNRNQVIDPRSHESDYSFDLADRLARVDEPLGTSTSYGYDAAGNLTSLIDPNGHTTSFAYDAFGRLSQIDQPLGKATAFNYDPAGNLIGRITAEDSLTLAYDAANRLTSISDGSSPLRSYGYDAADRLTSATDAQAKTLSFGYDEEGNLTSAADGRGESVSRSFDSRGNLISQSDGRGTLSYAYDQLNRMSSLTDPSSQVFSFGYDAEGNLTSTEIPNGVTTSTTYDSADRMLTTESTNAGAVLQRFEYGYDPAGNRTSEIDRNGDQTTYAYDALNRLMQFDPPGLPAIDYGYDPAGNRTSAGGVTYQYNALNQLTSDSSGTTYGYDGAGRLIREANAANSKSYDWDSLDQLVGFDDGSTSVSYSYDALGRRADRMTAAGTETAHYGDLTDITTRDTSSINVSRSFISGPAGLVEQQVGSTISFPLPDAHGDVATLADASGAVASRQEFDPWGEQLAGPPLEMGWLGAQERRTDPAIGITQMGIRTYDASQGRFLTEDPVLATLGYGITSNRFEYAGDNPVTMTDLHGRNFLEDAWNAGTHIITDPVDATTEAVDYWGDRTTEAVDYWSNSDSLAASVLGPLATLPDMALNSDRIDDYFKGCNAAQIVTGGIITGLTVPAAALFVEHGVAAAGATSAAAQVGAGSAAASSLFMTSTVAQLGPHILRDAC